MPTVVQHNELDNTPSDPQTLAYPSNVVAGNLLFAVVGLGDGVDVSVSGITDTVGSTWSRARLEDETVNGLHVEIWMAVAAASGANTVSVDFNSTPGSLRLCIGEVSGLTTSPLDQQNGAHSAVATTSPVTGQVTTTQAAEFLLGAIREASRTASVNSPWTELANLGTGRLMVGYRVVAATGTYEMTVTTDTGTPYAGAIASFLELQAGENTNITPLSAIRIGL